MKMKVTGKALRENYYCTFCGYCEVAHLMQGVEPDFYTAGIYGWNYDVYKHGNIALCTGYRSMPGINIHEIAEKYDRMADELYSPEYAYTEAEYYKALANLREAFWNEIKMYVIREY